MGANASKKVLDLNGAAEYLMFHPLTVRRLAVSGIIGRKIGARWRFRTEDLDRYLTNDGTVVTDNRGGSNEQVQAGNS